jgi:hypothetical protein
MVLPCVAREFHRSGGFAVLHQCIRPLIGARCAPGHHGYQRACVLIIGQASMGHSGHQGSQAPGRPILHLVSFSRRPRRVNWATSSTVPVVSVPLLGLAPFLRPGLRCCRAPRARAVKVGRRDISPRALGAVRPRLDGREHGARIRLAGIKSQMRVPC